jgi:hypothetical protein
VADHKGNFQWISPAEICVRLSVDDVSADNGRGEVVLFFPRSLCSINYFVRARDLAKKERGPTTMRTAAEIAGVVAGLLALPLAIDMLIALFVAAGLASLGDRRSARWVLKQEFVNLFRRMRGLERIDREPPGLEHR